MELQFANAMRRARSAAVVAAMVLLAWGSSGCAGGGGKPSLIVDHQGTSAVELYDLGASQLALGNLDEAEAAFRSSLELARKSGLDFAPPHEGMARILLRRNKLDEAEAEALHAQELDRHWTPVYWVLGKIAERNGNTDMALTHYEHGLIGAPQDPEITAAAADLLTRLGRPEDAEEFVRRSRREAGLPPAAGTTPPSARPSTGPQIPSRLDPFFPAGHEGLTPAVLAVFDQEQFTRGAMAVLIAGDGERGLAGALSSMGGLHEVTIRPPGDAEGRPEEPWIHRVLAMGLMETFPDGTFRPDGTLTRLALALWLEETIARLRNDHRVFELYRGQKSPFSDLADGHYGLNAARVAVDLKLLKLKRPGEFAPTDLVGMDEGIDALKRLAPALLGR